MAKIPVYKPSVEYKKEFSTPLARENFFYSIINYGRRIILTDELLNATTTEYTVPSGKLLYILGANLMSTAGAGFGQINLGQTGVAISALILCTSGINANSLFLALPMVLTEGQTIIFSSAGHTFFTLMGYEIDATMLPRLA